MSIATPKLITADELFEMGDIGRCELICGEIVTMAPAGFEHGSIAQRISRRIDPFVVKGDLGEIVIAEAGFLLRKNPDTVRAADLAFVRKERVPTVRRRGYFDGAPDLAVEVISPTDRMSEVQAKVREWLDGGTQSVWVVDPPNHAIDVYRNDGSVKRHRSPEVLSDDSVLPGFTLNLAEVFDAK